MKRRSILLIFVALAGNAAGDVFVDKHALPGEGSSNIQTTLDEMRKAQHVPGIGAVVIHDNEVIFAGGSGVADIETGRPVTADTLFYIGSVTKVLTATLALHLVESEALSLDDVVDGIANQSSGEPPQISVTHLLTHTSGLDREGNFGYWFTADFPDAVSLARYLEGASLRSEPGSTLHYSNIGFAALGPVIEAASGQTFADAMQTRLLDPLGMTATGASGHAARVANGYTPNGRLIPSELRPFAGVGRPVGDRYERMYHDAKAMSPAFGAHSTARDLGKLALFLLGNGNDEVLSLAMRERMRARQPTGRGLGVGFLRRGDHLLVRHGGWFAAHRSQLLLDAKNGIAVIVLANSDSADPLIIAEALYETALGVRPP